MELKFSIEQTTESQGAGGRARRWLRGFALHSASLALKPAPFAVKVCSEDGELVKGFPAHGPHQAEEMLAELKAECASLGVEAFLVKHGAPNHFVEQAGQP
jgi:hypothetical protein